MNTSTSASLPLETAHGRFDIISDVAYHSPANIVNKTTTD